VGKVSRYCATCQGLTTATFHFRTCVPRGRWPEWVGRKVEQSSCGCVVSADGTGDGWPCVDHAVLSVGYVRNGEFVKVGTSKPVNVVEVERVDVVDEFDRTCPECLQVFPTPALAVHPHVVDNQTIYLEPEDEPADGGAVWYGEEMKREPLVVMGPVVESTVPAGYQPQAARKFKTVTCDVCGKVCAHAGALTGHKRSHKAVTA
jgi:hypothetical protein